MSAIATSPLVQTITDSITIPVHNTAGEEVGSVEIDPSEFGGKVNRQLLHDAVLMYLANQRAGTHSTKRRGEVAGSTRKLFRQKGTGNARVGNRRTNKRRGGGTAKGPKPRDYEYHMPKKANRAATRMALLSKFHDKETIILDELELDEIKTQKMIEVLDNLDLDGVSCLIALGQDDIDDDQTVYLSARNIPRIEVLPARQLNTYAILRPQCLILTKAALSEVNDKLKWSDEASAGSGDGEED